jgi:hypothetical protein
MTNGSGTTGTDCTPAASGPNKGLNNATLWITGHASSLTTPTIFYTTCKVDFEGTHTTKLANNLAIFSTGGFVSNQLVTFDSTVSGTHRLMYWIVPYDAVASVPCASPGITTDQNFSTTTDVDMLVYSPCTINFANSSTHMGQIFGGSAVNINNKFTLDYTPLPVWGVDPNSLPTVNYNVDINYKREVQ